jgi:sulfite exporter TauE/SafE
MLSFGLGTLPALLLIGLASQKLTRFKQSTKIRQVAALIVLSLAIMHLFSIGMPLHSVHAGH